jgi:arsenate reductase
MNKPIQLYGIKNCDTVKKALVYLNDHDVNYQFIDFRQNPISKQVLIKMVDSVGWELLINKRSTTYRSLSEEEKSNINYDLVLSLPTLIKRPVMVRGENILVGFSEQQYAKLFDGSM